MFVFQLSGQPVLIGGTMGTCSYVLTGTQAGMEATFGSTCHGAVSYQFLHLHKIRDVIMSRIREKSHVEGLWPTVVYIELTMYLLLQPHSGWLVAYLEPRGYCNAEFAAEIAESSFLNGIDELKWNCMENAILKQAIRKSCLFQCILLPFCSLQYQTSVSNCHFESVKAGPWLTKWRLPHIW